MPVLVAQPAAPVPVPEQPSRKIPKKLLFNHKAGVHVKLCKGSPNCFQASRPPPALSLPNIAPNILRALPLQVNLLKIPDAKMNSSLGPDHRNPFK